MGDPIKDLGAAIILSAFEDLISPEVFANQSGTRPVNGSYTCERIRHVAYMWLFEEEEEGDGYAVTLKMACQMCDIPITSVRTLAKKLLN